MLAGGCNIYALRAVDQAIKMADALIAAYKGEDAE